jgi:hypothetical protein
MHECSPAGSKGCALGMQWTPVRDPQPRQIDRPKGPQHARRFVSDMRQKGPDTGAFSSPRPPFSRLGFLMGLYLAFSNSVLERLGYWMANIRLISPDAGR